MPYPRVIKENKVAMLLASEDTQGVTKYGIGLKQGDTILRTPKGTPILTMFKDLAEKFYEDYLKFGDKQDTTLSILPWQYEMLDRFLPLKAEEIENIITKEYPTDKDWTLDIKDPILKKIYGDKKTRTKEIKKWLDSCKPMALNAAYQIAKKYDSLNIAFILALYMEMYKRKNLKDKVGELADCIAETEKYSSQSFILMDFENFLIYYGCLLKLDGNIIIEKKSEDYSIIGTKVTAEILLGRNYKHYVNGELVEENKYQIAGLDYNKKAKNVEENKTFKTVVKNVSKDCWVKSIIAPSEEEYTQKYHIFFEVQDGIINNVKCVREMIIGMCNYPGMETSSEYEYEKDIQKDVILNEFDMVKKGRFLPTGFSFIDKPLPKSILRFGGNGGNNDYVESISSVYRSAYMTLCIETNDNGCIKNMEYSTYESFGSEYANMFSRPNPIFDKKEEVIDFLLWLMDEYSDDEYNEVIK